MDAISIGIIITILSVGAVLLLLFKRDLDCRACKPTSSKNANNKTIAAKPSANNNTSKKSTASKQVHFAEIISTSSDENTDTTQKTDGAEPVVVTATKVNKQQGANKNGKNKSKNVENNNNNEPSVTNRNTLQDFISDTHVAEPSNDELDSSILLQVFNPAKTVANKAKQKRKRQNSEQVSYSSEKLFSLIAASNLSKDEIELAVETLLNKLESGESDWQQPKSDPIQRLKNQLRDSESALTTETQNHKQSRARLMELKVELQNERSAKSIINDELTKLKNEIGLVNAGLEKAQTDLSKHRLLQEQIKEESSKVIARLEKDNDHLQSLLNRSQFHDDEISKLRQELTDKNGQLQRYELTNQTSNKKLNELENTLRATEIKLDQLRSKKQHDDYEACAKIAELESDRVALDKALKDHVARFKEVSDTNNLLEKSVKELQVMNGRQDDMLKRVRDERHINEASMKRTLCEMEQELRELQEKLSANTATSDDRLRKEVDQFERELNDAGQREQKLAAKMKQLREGLSQLFPDLKLNDQQVQNGTEDWVHQYLVALKQLAKTVDELRNGAGNSKKSSPDHENGDGGRSLSVSPNGRPVVNKSSTTSKTNGSRLSPRIGSPTSNGRSSSRGEWT